jgi:hypothetical protein
MLKLIKHILIVWIITVAFVTPETLQETMGYTVPTIIRWICHSPLIVMLLDYLDIKLKK